MPVLRRSLGGLGAPQMGADGTFREPPWSTDCQPYQCGAPAQYITDQMRRDCPFWGSPGVLNCSSVYCSPSPWCTGGGNTTAVPPASTPTPAPTAPAPQTAPAAAPPQPATSPLAPVTVQTDTGPQIVMLPSDQVPGGPLVPAIVHIPNIWDSLDPSAVSQFEYRGLSRTFPPWISAAYRRSLTPAAAPAGAGSGIGNIPWWVWLAIGGTAYALRGSR